MHPSILRQAVTAIIFILPPAVGPLLAAGNDP